MAGNVNGIGGPPPPRPAGAGSGPPADGPRPRSDAPGPPTGETVALTGIARTLGGLETGPAEGAGIDSGRVEALRAAIQSGEYRVDAGRIADGLVALEEQLGVPRR
jgi:negative regulator of flagellin synthesis FlgM